MFPPIYSTLRASSAVVAIVGNRIGRHGEIHGDATRPYITWQQINVVPENELSAAPDTDLVTVQINCMHETDAGVEALAKAVRDAVEPFAHITGMPVDQRDAETRLYWIAIQLDWWLARN